MTAVDDIKETPITTSNKDMAMDDNKAASDISDEPELYTSLDKVRGEIDRTPNTTGNAGINETNHTINQGHTILAEHIINPVNHLEAK